MMAISIFSALMLTIYLGTYIVKEEIILVSNWAGKVIDLMSSQNKLLVEEIIEKSNLLKDTKKTNPHWNKNKCSVCHESLPKNEPVKVRTQIDLCKECHYRSKEHLYIHPTEISLPEDRLASIKGKFGNKLRLDKDNKITCLTCHDLLDQCLPERSHQKLRNPNFLLGGPYAKRHSLCYYCHDETMYVKVNSHDQINEDGFLKTKTCRLCHEINIDKGIKKGLKSDIKDYPILSGFEDERTLLCVRCHKKIDHPAGSFVVKSINTYRHLVRIRKDIKQTLDEQIRITGIELPVEPGTNRIYCGTCHDAHEPGVIYSEKKKEIKNNKRLRAENICKHCHEIYGEALINDSIN